MPLSLPLPLPQPVRFRQLPDYNNDDDDVRVDVNISSGRKCKNTKNEKIKNANLFDALSNMGNQNQQKRMR